MDLGNVEQQIAVFAPRNSEVLNVEISKEPNPNLIKFYLGNSTLAFYKDSGKGFIYDYLGHYCGRFEIHDLSKVGSQILTFLREIKVEKG